MCVLLKAIMFLHFGICHDLLILVEGYILLYYYIICFCSVFYCGASTVIFLNTVFSR